MAYGAISLFLKPRRDPKEAVRLAAIEIKNAIAQNRLEALLEQEAEEITKLMDKADRVEDLDREVKNLEWLLKTAKAAAETASEAPQTGETKERVFVRDF